MAYFSPFNGRLCIAQGCGYMRCRQNTSARRSIILSPSHAWRTSTIAGTHSSWAKWREKCDYNWYTGHPWLGRGVPSRSSWLAVERSELHLSNYVSHQTMKTLITQTRLFINIILCVKDQQLLLTVIVCIGGLVGLSAIFGFLRWSFFRKKVIPAYSTHTLVTQVSTASRLPRSTDSIDRKNFAFFYFKSRLQYASMRIVS